MATKSAIYKEILRQYDAIRTASANQLREKQSRIYNQLPRIYEIDQTVSKTGVRISKQVLANPNNSANFIANLKEEMTALKIEKRNILLENGYDKDYLTQNYKCINCKDTGYIGSEKCACFHQKFVDKAYGVSNLKDIVKTENFDFFDFRFYSDLPDPKSGISPLKNIQNIYHICTNFVHNFSIDFTNLLLYGSTGLGKTFLCNCIAKDLLDKGKTVMYVTASQLFKIIEDDRFNKNEEQEPSTYLDDILSIDLFIIDDLGTEFSTILSSSELFNIINTRLLEKKPVIISTNLAPADLINQYSDRIVSRITGAYKTLKFFGDDIRIKKKFQK